MSQVLCSADMVQERRVRTLRAETVGAADRRFHSKPVLIFVERTDGCQDEIDRCVGAMPAASSRPMSYPANELRELSQLQVPPVMLVLDQESPVGL